MYHREGIELQTTLLESREETGSHLQPYRIYEQYQTKFLKEM